MQPNNPPNNQPSSPPVQPATNPPARDKGMEMVLPINRSGWSIAAGYVALFNIPFFIPAPIGLILGLIALNDIKKHPGRGGSGRAWFAIIYGLIVIIFVAVVVFIPRR